MLEKECTHCRITKAITEFNKSNKGKYGYRSECRECQSKYNKQWHIANPHKNSENWKKMFQKYHERIRARQNAERHIPLESLCRQCGSTDNLTRHHPDYNKPMVVVTLCRKCHSQLSPRRAR